MTPDLDAVLAELEALRAKGAHDDADPIAAIEYGAALWRHADVMQAAAREGQRYREALLRIAACAHGPVANDARAALSDGEREI